MRLNSHQTWLVELEDTFNSFKNMPYCILVLTSEGINQKRGKETKFQPYLHFNNNVM